MIRDTILIMLLVFTVTLTSAQGNEISDIVESHGFSFPDLAPTWDEALPLGNGSIGLLVWNKQGKLRFTLNRADLWDTRPISYYNDPRFKYDTLSKYVGKGDIGAISKIVKYNKAPAPAKIPAAALEFDMADWGPVKKASLNLYTAIATVEWENGVQLECFVHATKSIGWYKFTNLPKKLVPTLISPDYDGKNSKNDDSWWLLKNLGYPAPSIKHSKNSIVYRQKGYKNHYFKVSTQWQQKGSELVGHWSIYNNTDTNIKAGYFEENKNDHLAWWSGYWAKSRIAIPDPVLESQYYRDMYKFGAVTRPGAPAISLQAVWTPDDNKIAPWFGDFHNDLNTQLSYWPAYTGNRLDLAVNYLEWNWKNRDEYLKYTRDYFGAAGMNIPGVSTIDGAPMGSWAPYSLSVTAAGWVGQHFYRQWRYGGDTEFLEKMAYPWIRDVALFFESIAVAKNGKKTITLSASPEIYDFTKKSYFKDITNFDLSLIRFTYQTASEMASALGDTKATEKWQNALKGWPELAKDANGALLLAPDHPLQFSHRHHSHLMAIYPLGLVDVFQGKKDARTIKASLSHLDSLGTKKWVGYSFPWQACLKARNFDGAGAAKALRIFSTAFCLKNSFHVNGDQTQSGYSDFTYRPFTLEGNFAFAAAIHEMLLQSHSGFIDVFPAIPKNWEDVSYKNLRAEGAFLISAERVNGKLRKLVVIAEKGGRLRIKNNFKTDMIRINGEQQSVGDFIELETQKGDTISMEKP